MYDCAMNTLGIIQARMSSSRLPGKVLREVGGIPLLLCVIQGVEKSSSLNDLIVATSLDLSDQPIEEYCRKIGIRCFRGPLENVAKRFTDVLLAEEPDCFVRVCADSPFYDGFLLDSFLKNFAVGNFDIVTNACQRSYPKGQTMEVFDTKVFFDGFSKMSTPRHLEHVTLYFYENSSKYRIKNITCARGDLSDVNMCVDTLEDLERANLIMAHLKKPLKQATWEELLALGFETESQKKSP